VKNFSGVGLGEGCVLGKKPVAGSVGSQKCQRIPLQITLRTDVLPAKIQDSSVEEEIDRNKSNLTTKMIYVTRFENSTQHPLSKQV
jgi:hypothetical protein